jgi:hypothetical protein
MREVEFIPASAFADFLKAGWTVVSYRSAKEMVLMMEPFELRRNDDSSLASVSHITSLLRKKLGEARA